MQGRSLEILASLAYTSHSALYDSNCTQPQSPKVPKYTERRELSEGTHLGSYREAIILAEVAALESPIPLTELNKLTGSPGWMLMKLHFGLLTH